MAYLVGSVPTGILVARAHGVDLHRVGSGNIGATNVARALGMRLGIWTLLGDAAKGALPIVVGRLAFDAPLPAAAAGLAAVLGHVFPAFPGTWFRGGKGVATGFGAILALVPPVAGVAFGIYVAVFLALRISSLGSLCATGSVPPVLIGSGAPWPHVALGVSLFALILFTHRSNIHRLLTGKEGSV